MRKPAVVLVLALVVAMLATTGCAGLIKQGVENATGVKVEGDKVTMNKDGKSVEIGGAQTGRLPESFPSDYPMYEPLTITTGVKVVDNGTHFSVTANTTGAFEDVKNFYDEKLKAAGWDVKTTGTTSAGASAGSVNGTKGADKTAVQVVQTAPGQKVQIVLTIDMP